MESTSVMHKILLLILFAIILITKEASAKQHVVGGSQGWDESVDFSSWASSQTFKVGDQLVFKYSSMHSVVELSSESAYNKCDIGTSLNSMSDGNSVVKLTKPGTRYFACGTSGHCGQGMKVKIITVRSSDASSPLSSSSASTSTSTPNSTSDAAVSCPLAAFCSILALLVLGFLQLIML